MRMQWVLKAANLKKHVLCEKPVAANASDALEMIRACIKNGTTNIHYFTKCKTNPIYLPDIDASQTNQLERTCEY